MYSKIDGDGPRIFVGLHGWSGDHRTFDPVLTRRPADATFISYDLPGCGRSDKPHSWTLDALSAEISDELSRIGSDGLTLVGNCSGALLGLLALPRVGSLVGRLVLIDPFAYVPWYFRVFVGNPIGKYAYYTTFANPIGRWITNLSLREHRTEGSDLTESFGSVDHDAAYRYLELLTSIDGIGRFAEVRHPIQIVYGARTFGAIKRSVSMWQGIWPQAEAIELPAAAHLPIQEDPDGLCRVIFNEQPMKTGS